MLESFSQNAPTVTASRLPDGRQSYLQTLETMAGLVRQAPLDYSLKQFTNSLFNRHQVKGHNFIDEIRALFFSAEITSLTGGIRLMLNWCRTQNEQLKRVAAIVMTRLLCSVHCWPLPVSSLDS